MDLENKSVVDLSLDIFTGMPYYPGDPQPSVEQYKHVLLDGVSIKRLALGTHSGTHIDAPAHFLANGKTVDRLNPLAACGQAKIVDVSKSLSKKAMINKADISRKNEEVLLLYTSYYAAKPLDSGVFPTLSEQFAKSIVDAGYKCVGIDSPTAGSPEVHRILLGAGIVIVENLSNRLAELISKKAYFICLPIRVLDGDGAPARALAII
ncbi:MAG: cyclase family protein [Thermoprotei archaeon]